MDFTFDRCYCKAEVLNLGYVRRLQGVCKEPTGVRKIQKNHPNEAYLGRIFNLGVCEGDTILIWGYAEGYNFDLGVREYQKIENPCCKV
jgi:hypothetical protein